MILSHGRRFITIQDYKDGKMISSLDIKNLTQNDFGKYSCIARNSEGEGRVNIMLQQLGISSSASAYKISFFCILYSLVLCISKM